MNRRSKFIQSHQIKNLLLLLPIFILISCGKHPAATPKKSDASATPELGTAKAAFGYTLGDIVPDDGFTTNTFFMDTVTNAPFTMVSVYGTSDRRIYSIMATGSLPTYDRPALKDLIESLTKKYGVLRKLNYDTSEDTYFGTNIRLEVSTRSDNTTAITLDYWDKRLREQHNAEQEAEDKKQKQALTDKL